MPTNLLIEEPKLDRQPVNLLMEETVDIQKNDRQKSFIEDVYNGVQSGLARTWSTISSYPAGIYDIAAMPQNFLMKSIGRPDLQVKSPDWLMDNPVAEVYDYISADFEKKITPTKNFQEALDTKDFSGIGRHLAIEVAKNAPQQIGIILSYMAGYPGAGLAGMGLLETTQSLKEGRKTNKDPAMNAYNSLAKGTIEAGFESIGTMGILNKWSKVLRKSFGTKTTKEITKDVFKTIFHSMLGEGNEEFWTSLAQDFTDFSTGKKDAMKGSLVRAFEAGTIGGISGGLITGPVAIQTGRSSASLEKMQQEVNQVTETLAEEAKVAKEKVVEPTKAPVTPEVTPETPVVEAKASKVARSVEAKAIAKNLTENFGELAQYTPTTIKKQANKIDKLIKTDIEGVKSIIRGEEPLPKGLLGGTVIKAMEDYAVETGDVSLIMDIANSPLTAETSVHAQELRVLAERSPTSPVKVISDVTKAREKKVIRKHKVKSTKKMKTDTVKEIKTEIKKVVSTKETWSDFIKSIQC